MSRIIVTWKGLSPRRRWWLLAGSLLLIAVAASGIGIRNGFAYDDVYVIKQNRAVHSLHAWWKLFARSYWPPMIFCTSLSILIAVSSE